ncbi:hypothetical protein llap_11480 [Limosa lapponica baueri]|uniref:Uncharacterized protein n=1 Tax=Limosa lapponica baueri TaxID=1758121 RepID=A0A2I0TWN0_LIMLA|nr:hypothetical protein llap_11480 [Limosa lapponica baueri]
MRYEEDSDAVSMTANMKQKKNDPRCNGLFCLASSSRISKVWISSEFCIELLVLCGGFSISLEHLNWR